jgi:hypothetical protein
MTNSKISSGLSTNSKKMTKQEEQEILYAETLLKVHSKGAVIVDKKGWFWKTIHVLVVIFTLGGNRNFLKGYYTTIAKWIGVPEDWEERSLAVRIAILEHELVHVEQCKKFGFGSAVLGLPVYTVLYLLLPLPIGLAYFRWRFEREAYAHGINVRVRMEPWRYPYLIDSAVKQLTTGLYGWTWPFKNRVRRYFEKHCPIPIPSPHDVRIAMSGVFIRDVQ